MHLVLSLWHRAHNTHERDCSTDLGALPVDICQSNASCCVLWLNQHVGPGYVTIESIVWEAVLYLQVFSEDTSASDMGCLFERTVICCPTRT